MIASNAESEQIKNRRRGQIEIFGLAIIVILVSIGFFIFISIKSQQPPSNPQKDFTNDKIANDFVLSIIDTNVYPCTEYTVKDLIVDCSRDRRIRCGSLGEDSCAALNRSVTLMINETFKERNYKFRFYSEGLLYSPPGCTGTSSQCTKELFNITHLGCTSSSVQGQRGVSIISKYPAPGNVYLNLNICR
ncbi:MAG TPA: hypothetical protein VEC16_02750 [Alphaproteobacteria bacterium]|nr:hypothetical protein [Alphaproteobacteria bacterium]